MPQPHRLAVVGIENSHATEIVRYCNRDTGRTRAEVVALVRGDDDRTRELAELGGIDTVVERSQDLLGEVDALVVTNRDGGRHRAEAEPFLRAGLPVWVDKPLATTVRDAEALLEAADAGGTRLTSYSPLRWVRDTVELAAGAADLGPLQAVTVTGPADPGSEHGGIFFYGIHCADVAQRLAPGRAEHLHVRLSGSTVSVHYLSGGTAVTLQLVEPDGDRRVPFHASVVGRHGVAARELVLGAGYVEPGITAFLGLLDSGRLPVPYPEVVAPLDVLERVRAELAQPVG